MAEHAQRALVEHLLPSTLSSFGPVANASETNWCSVKSRRVLRRLKPGERATNLSKLELFSNRSQLKRSYRIRDEMLSNLSFVAFWRLFDVQNNRLVQRRRETMLAVSGAGWPSHARRTHPQHEEFARRTLCLLYTSPSPRD